MSTAENDVEKNEPGGRLRLIGAAYLIVYMHALNSLCTQFITYRVTYHPALGASLFAHVYPSFAWWDWMFRLYDYTPGSYNYTFIFFMLGVLAGVLAYVLQVGFRSYSSHKHDDTHDTTYFAIREEV